MPRAAVVALVLTAGASLAIQPALNAQLGRHVTGLGAAFVSLGGSALVIGLVLAAAGDVGDLRGVGGVSPVYLVGGLCGALNVTVALFAVSRLGAGGVAAVTVTSQLVVSGAMDRFGLLGLDRVALSPTRVAGFVLLLGGVALVTLR
jgi:transporter family-2 protein